MRRCRRDQNQPEIIAALRGLGWQCFDTSAVGPNACPGFPDLLVVRAGRVVLCEIKHGKAELTHDEAVFHLVYAGELAILRTVDDCIRLTEGER
jgi:hypothetical protein